MNRPVVAPAPCLISRAHLDGIRSRSVDQSQQMTRNWTNTVAQKSRQQAEERENRDHQRSVDKHRAYEAMREQQRLAQRAQIEQIEAKMRRAQPGPRLLDSAALLSDCLHVQQSQRQEMALRNISNRQQVIYEGRLLRLQNHQWMMEHQHRYQENHQRAMRYKQDLSAMIDKRKARRDMELFHQQRQQMEDYPLQQAIEKERKEMERRRIQMRQTATDAMRMAEQRRLREKMQDQVQGKICALYLEGKEKQEEIREQQQKVLADGQRARQEMGREKVAGILEEAAQEEERMEKAVLSSAADEHQQQLVAKEKAETERKKMLKAQRIQFHLEEMEAEKQRKEEGEKRSQEAVIVRLANEEVTNAFEREQRDQRRREAERLRASLTGQWEAKQATEKVFKEGVQLFTNRHCDFSENHKDFVKYAKEALEVAQSKCLPVQPFVRAINAYRRDNFVEEKPLLPHLEVRQPAVYYDRPGLPKNNSKEVIRYNIEQLRALNPIISG